MKHIPKIASTVAVLILLLGPAIGYCDNLEAAAAAVAQAAVDQAADQAAVNPGEEIGKAIDDAMGSMDMGNAILIPILAIIGVFIAPMLVIICIVFLAYRHRERKEQRNHETIRLMIEKGIEIPPNISFGEAPETGSPLKRGLKFIGIGAGLIVFFIVLGSTELAGIGAIPLFIGLAYLLNWHLEKNKIESTGE